LVDLLYFGNRACGAQEEGKEGNSPTLMAIDTEVDLCNVDGAYSVQARLNISLPSLEQDVAEVLLYTVHQICPYSKVTRGNVNLVNNLM
jgi:organic hydroperoxide reductase OsmC/OhrA